MGLKMLFEEYQDVCLVLIPEWSDSIYSESPCCMMHPIKFLLKRIYGFEDVGLRIPRWLFTALPFLICELDDFSYSVSPYCLTPPIKFLFETIYGLKDVV